MGEETPRPKIESILSADIGSLWTRVALVDVVSGEYRFIARAAAPTSAELPFGDITVGLYNAIAELERLTGRKIVEEGHLVIPQQPNGSGVDAFIAASSAAPAMRVVLLALVRDITARSAQHAAESTYANVLDLITVDEPLAAGEEHLPEGEWLRRQVQRLIALQPDVALIVGGVDGGPVTPLLKLAQAVEGAARERAALEQSLNVPSTHLPVIFAGNQSARGKITALLDELTDLRLSDNVRPKLNSEQLASAQEQLDSIYLQRHLPAMPGYPRLASWTDSIIPTALADGIVTRYVATQYNRDVVVADVGASTVSGFLTNDAAGGPNLRAGERAFYRVAKGDFGMAYGLPNLLRDVGAAAVLRWLPFPLGENELTDWALNRMLRPLSLSADERDLQIEHAFAREAMRYIAARLREQATPGTRPAYDLLIGTGGLLANAPSPAHAAMLLLDGLEPEGLPTGSVELALDATLLLPHIGTIASANPAAAAYVFDRDSLLWLGTAIVPLPAVANPSLGQAAVTVTVEYSDADAVKVAVNYGDLKLVPLRPDQKAALTVQPGRDFRVGNGERGKLVRTMGEEVRGGYVGLIIDARGRPLRLPTEDAARIATLQNWQRELGITAAPDAASYTPITLPPLQPTRADLPPIATRMALSPNLDAEPDDTDSTFIATPSDTRAMPAMSTFTTTPTGTETMPAAEEQPTAEEEEVPPWLMSDEVADFAAAPAAPTPVPPTRAVQDEAEVSVPPWLMNIGNETSGNTANPIVPPWLIGADEEEAERR